MARDSLSSDESPLPVQTEHRGHPMPGAMTEHTGELKYDDALKKSSNPNQTSGETGMLSFPFNHIPLNRAAFAAVYNTVCRILRCPR